MIWYAIPSSLRVVVSFIMDMASVGLMDNPEGYRAVACSLFHRNITSIAYSIK